MQLQLNHLALLTFITIAYHCKTLYSEELSELIQSLREKIRYLEEAGRIQRNYEPYTEPDIKSEETYDFIVVGGGSAGSALVHRLTEISDWKILLLEAGGEPDALSEVPFWSPLQHMTEMNWNFTTEREENLFLGFDDQKLHWPRGKVLGGSSILNFMVYSRCAKEDYDKWARQGNPGWSYKQLLPYFKRMETCRITNADEELRGYEGPISVEKSHTSKLGDAFVKAAEKFGYKFVDYNGKKIVGASHVQATLKHGLRCSGESCYIRPIKDRKNLTIRLKAHVTKVLISDKQARGIEYERNGNKYRAYAEKEVILSAGVINSAHILLLSGVGPKEQLLKFGIDLQEDLPVGQKIYDHQGFWGLGFVLNKPPVLYNTTDVLSYERFEELFNQGKGILTSTMAVDGLAFIKTKLAPDDLPDVELILVSAHFCQDSGARKLLRISKEVLESMCEPPIDATLVTVIVDTLHPRSYGRLELASTSPYVQPRLYAGYFNDAEGHDMKTMVAGIREAIKIIKSPPFEEYGVELWDRSVEGCEKHRKNSDEYWECAARHLSFTVFHHTTTCKMGPANDPESVVDNRLRVYGIRGLRVVDASVIPIQLTGHTNIPAYLIGEKAADMIKEEYLNEDLK